VASPIETKKRKTAVAVVVACDDDVDDDDDVGMRSRFEMMMEWMIVYRVSTPRVSPSRIART